MAERSPADRVLVMAGSTRSGSLNRALADRIVERLRSVGESADVVDLGDHPLPLYHEDIEQLDGVPATAGDLARRLASAEVLVIVSPEYNGTFTPLLKNTVDWLSRVDTAVLAHLTVLLASASPGRGGGANGLAMVRTWMGNMGVHVGDVDLVVGSADADGHGTLVSIADDELDRFVRQARPYRAAA